MPQFSFSSYIVGARFHPGAEDILDTLADGAVLLLIREPQNPHDPNAIAVGLGLAGLPILGYIPRTEAGYIASLMDKEAITRLPATFNRARGRHRDYVSATIETIETIEAPPA